MQRLEAAWGPPKDRSAGQMVGMVREWFGQLDRFGVRSVEAAFTHVIGTHKFQWAGAIVEIVSYCAKDDGDWRDALGMREDRRWVAEPEAFERDGRTAAEEIAHRVATIASMKREAGFNSEAPAEVFARSEKNPASQSVEVSAHIRNSCAARRARGEKTCDLSCHRVSCALRESEPPPNPAPNQTTSPPTASESFDESESLRS